MSHGACGKTIESSDIVEVIFFLIFGVVYVRAKIKANDMVKVERLAGYKAVTYNLNRELSGLGQGMES